MIKNKQDDRQFFGYGKVTFSIFCVLSLIRLWLSLKTKIFFDVNTPVDDMLLVNYSILPWHFAASMDRFVLAKTISFPLFLDLVHFSGLPYSLVMALIWITIAFLAVALVRKIINPIKWVDICVFAFALFLPVAFDVSVGTRFYRNIIIAPFAFLLFLLFALFLFKISETNNSCEENQSTNRLKKHSFISLFVLSIVIGIVFTFNYYINENGVWLMPIFLVVTALGIILSFYQPKNSMVKIARRKRAVILFVICLVPILIFTSLTEVYKDVNEYYFGVHETNTRIDGEFGKFIKNVYSIESPNRTGVAWAPTDAIEKAFAVSDTLKTSPGLKYMLIEKNHFFGDIRNGWIPGDYLTWTLYEALNNSGMWINQKQISDYFEKVNKEIDAAFADGRLTKDTKFQLSSAGGGRSPEEILDLWPLFIQGLKCSIYFDGYSAYDLRTLQSSNGIEIMMGTPQFSADYITNMSLDIQPYSGYFAHEEVAQNFLARNIIKGYRFTGMPLFILSLVGFILCLINVFRKKRRTRSVVIQAVFMGSMLATALAAIFGIAWFSEFLVWPDPPSLTTGIMKFYSVGAVPCIALFEILGLCSLYEFISTKVTKYIAARAMSKCMNESGL